MVKGTESAGITNLLKNKEKKMLSLHYSSLL